MHVGGARGSSLICGHSMFIFAHVSGNLRQTERLFFMVEYFIGFLFFDCLIGLFFYREVRFCWYRVS